MKASLSIGEALDYACQYAMAGNHESAIGLCRGVLIHESKNFEAIERLGSSLFATKQYYEALYWFDRGLKIDRKQPLALTNYGLCLSQVGHPDEGLAYLERAAINASAKQMKTAPAVLALIHNNLGNTLEKLKRYPQALAALDRGLGFNPNDGFALYNRGIVLLRLNRTQDAIASFNQALALNPADADARYNRSMALLRIGDLKQGFEDYEARLLTSENKVINLGLPADKQWDGSDLTGKTILVHCEQGLGDDIQFLRYLRPLIDQKNPVEMKLICHKATAPLVIDAGAPVILLQSGVPLDHTSYDCWVPLMSLALRLGTVDEARIPHPFYFPVTTERADNWKPHLPARRPRVAVCWAGNFHHKNDEHRSIPLSTFGKLFDVDGVDFVSVQQMRPGETDEFAALKQTHGNLTALFLDDLRDTAAVLLQCDLVIAVDTAVAHLAATLGIPTRILLPAFSTDWRWGINRTDSPWYPTATLDRQPKIGDWASVIGRLRTELAELAAQKRTAA